MFFKSPIQNYVGFNTVLHVYQSLSLLCTQGETDGEKKEAEDDIGDLDDLLRREREMEKKRKESAPADSEVKQYSYSLLAYT